MRPVFAALAVLVVATPALAAEPYGSALYEPYPTTERDPSVDLSIRIGGGAMVKPDYVGSDDYMVSPFPIVSLEYLRLPRFGEFGGPSTGFSIGPSFDVVGDRDAGDNPALIGLNEIDTAVELGGKVSYSTPILEVFAAVRRGFGGHEGVIAEFGANAIFQLTERMTLTAGPLLTVADGKYFDTYFSITPAEAARSGLPAYNAGSGLRSAGIDAELVYNINENLDAHLYAGWDRLVGDAADSPIVLAAGSDDQFRVGLGLSYRLDLDLFD